MYSPIITPLRHKKGDLSLSINAIVVLILAITMLGLGLGFIRNLFGGASSKVSAALEATNLKNPADSSHPVTMEDKITMKYHGEKEVEVGFYNTRSGPVDDVNIGITACKDSTGVPITTLPTVAAPAATSVPPSSGVGYKAILSLNGNDELVGGKTYICTLSVFTGPDLPVPGMDPDPTLQTNQFFMAITS